MDVEEAPPPPPYTRWPPDAVNEAAIKVSGKPLLFQTAADAAAAAAATGGRQWAVDIPAVRSGAAPKKYVACDGSMFLDILASTSGTRCAYEVLQSNLPCWPFFDLDGKPGTHPVEFAQRADEVVGAAIDELKRCSAVDVEVIGLTCSRPAKQSRHVLILPLANSATGLSAAPLEGLADAKLLAQRVAAAITPDAASLIDLGVYHHGRPFRMEGSTKLNDPHQAPFLVNRVLTSPYPSRDSAVGSLVHPLVAHGPTLSLRPSPSLPPALPAAPAATAAAQALKPARNWPALLRATGSARPLLEIKRSMHPAITYSVHGGNDAPEEFRMLQRFAFALLRKQECSTIASWRYVRAVQPEEAVVEFIGVGGVCPTIGRRRAS